eukprot:4519813-Karenia_brevis.AAC.1
MERKVSHGWATNDYQWNAGLKYEMWKNQTGVVLKIEEARKQGSLATDRLEHACLLASSFMQIFQYNPYIPRKQ